ncbi:hypothetical protein BT96DRAFT_916286 [Gymnopus androsaceus JB14]|uniref:Uncharacterized protein n=1 Tax=Gymnopus androsaceus JB14 TaxID=1447944 RepID=A0A6A4I8Q1_9AGAR|nr:hypothetical protein BT96DRAFT_916286 [Gymnopus androsaceus JB14]
MSSRDRTQHALNGSLDDRDTFNRTLSRQEVMILFQKYPFIFKARGITQSELESATDSDDISTPVRSIIGGAIFQYGSLATAERECKAMCEQTITLGSPPSNTARLFQVMIRGHPWVAKFWQESWQELSGTIYMELYDPRTNAVVALSPRDVLFAEAVGPCSSLQALEEHQAGIRDCETGEMLGGCTVRSVEKDTWVLLGKMRYYLVLQKNGKGHPFIIDAPYVPSTTDHVFANASLMAGTEIW